MTKHEKKVCDQLWQIKITKDSVCSMPGCNRIGNEGHHIMKRRYLNTRWAIENGRALCRDHHLWAETNPQVYEDLIVEEIGAEAYEALRQKSLMVVRQFYDEIKEELK